MVIFNSYVKLPEGKSYEITINPMEIPMEIIPIHRPHPSLHPYGGTAAPGTSGISLRMAPPEVTWSAWQCVLRTWPGTQRSTEP